MLANVCASGASRNRPSMNGRKRYSCFFSHSKANSDASGAGPYSIVSKISRTVLMGLERGEHSRRSFSLRDVRDAVRFPPGKVRLLSFMALSAFITRPWDVDVPPNTYRLHDALAGARGRGGTWKHQNG